MRATTKDGPGPWSDYLEVDTSFASPDDSRLEIVSLNASYKAIFGVMDNGRDDNTHHWQSDDDDEVRIRILRRRAGLGEEYQARVNWLNWVDLDSFEWGEHARRITKLGWKDHDVQPDTLYEYAVQLKRGAVVEPPTEPKFVRTDPLPESEDRLPIFVHGLEAIPTDRGILLTWELPDDPTLTGLVIGSSCEEEGSHAHCSESGPILPPDATEYLITDYDYHPELEFCFSVRTMNNYELSFFSGVHTCVDGSEMSHCQVNQQSINSRVADGIGPLITIQLNSCEEARVQVIRRELTADGFKVTRSRQQCEWTPREALGWRPRAGVLSWWYADADIKPGSWYVYEIQRKLRNGEERTTFHSRVFPSQYSYVEGDWDPCVRPDNRGLSGAL